MVFIINPWPECRANSFDVPTLETAVRTFRQSSRRASRGTTVILSPERQAICPARRVPVTSVPPGP
jgi:hypothetical protein